MLHGNTVYCTFFESIGANFDLRVDLVGNQVNKGEFFGSTISYFRYV